jgi:hypothetical protein
MTRYLSRAFLAAAKARHRTVTLGLCSAILVASPAFASRLGMVAPEQWQPHAKVGILDDVTLRIHWHDSIKLLREAAVEHDVSAVDLHGFSILRRNTETGEWVCDLFVVRMHGALVDNDRTVTFGHEVLHCFGFRHEE